MKGGVLVCRLKFQLMWYYLQILHLALCKTKKKNKLTVNVRQSVLTLEGNLTINRYDDVWVLLEAEQNC